MMKKLFFALSIVLLIGACSNDQQPTPKEIQKVEDQVAKDQAAQDSMEKVIQQQIEASQTEQK
jgi:PBP1b-binding outer membrane lipoprotein LpoB